MSTNECSPLSKAAANSLHQEAVRAARHMLVAASSVIEHIRARVIRAFALYLAGPAGALVTLTSADKRALAAVLDRGDVLLSAGTTRCAALVERLTRSTWSHVSMYVGPLDDVSDPLCIVEADIAGGVRPIRLSQLDARRVCVLRPNGLDDTERRRLAESVVSWIGSEYDLRHAWRLARNLVVWPWRARLGSIPTTNGNGATRFICSSLIAHAFALIGYSILPVEPPRGRADVADHAHLTPADFERAPVFEVVWRVNTSDQISQFGFVGFRSPHFSSNHYGIVTAVVQRLEKLETRSMKVTLGHREVEILVIGAHLHSAYQLYAHVIVAAATGMADEITAAIMAGAPSPVLLPTDICPAELPTWAFSRSKKVKAIPYAPAGERLIGMLRREYLDQSFFWNAGDLARKLDEFSDYYNAARVRRGLASPPRRITTVGRSTAGKCFRSSSLLDQNFNANT